MYRYLYLPFVLLLLLIVACSEPAEMNIDPYLKDHSKRFAVKEKNPEDAFQLEIGHFTAYENTFGLGWMDASGIMEFFDESSIQTFSTDNNDNYIYNQVIASTKDKDLINNYAVKFDLPLDSTLNFELGYVGYMYAAHDEYSMIFMQQKNKEISGFLSNGFDTYEIQPVWEQNNTEGKENELIGYQFKLYDEYVGSLQISESKIFRMTTEYCDATEVILAGIASSLLKIQKI